MKIQREVGVVSDKSFNCDYCKKAFTTKRHYTHHLAICFSRQQSEHKIEIETIKKQYEKEMDSLKQSHQMEKERDKQDEARKFQENKVEMEKEVEQARQDERKKCQEQIEKIKTECQQQIDRIKLEYDKYKDDLYNKTLEDKNKLLAKKEETLVQLANRPTTITNSNSGHNTNNTIIMEDLGLTKKKIGKIMEEHFTEERLLEGVQGVVNIVFPSLLTSDGQLKYNVKDSSRNIFEFSKDGKMRRDEDGQYLATMVYDGGFKEMSKVYLDTVHVGPVEEYTNATDEKIDRVVDKFREIKHIKSSPKKFTKCIKKKIMEVKQ
jgi:hypothetical protein